MKLSDSLDFLGFGIFSKKYPRNYIIFYASFMMSMWHRCNLKARHDNISIGICSQMHLRIPNKEVFSLRFMGVPSPERWHLLGIFFLWKCHTENKQRNSVYHDIIEKLNYFVNQWCIYKQDIS